MLLRRQNYADWKSSERNRNLKSSAHVFQYGFLASRSEWFRSYWQFRNCMVLSMLTVQHAWLIIQGSEYYVLYGRYMSCILYAYHYYTNPIWLVNRHGCCYLTGCRTGVISVCIQDMWYILCLSCSNRCRSTAEHTCRLILFLLVSCPGQKRRSWHLSNSLIFPYSRKMMSIKSSSLLGVLGLARHATRAENSMLS